MSKRRPSQSTFAALTLQTARQMERAFDRFRAGKIDLAALRDRLHSVLANGHARAGYFGRWRAGDESPFDEHDREFGSHAADEEEHWLGPFMEDVRAGKFGATSDALNMAAVMRRANAYARKLRGSANFAWAATLDDDTDLYWTLDGLEVEHCNDCPHYEASSPFKPHTRPTDPGACETECLFECLCFWRTEDGRTGFKAVAL